MRHGYSRRTRDVRPCDFPKTVCAAARLLPFWMIVCAVFAFRYAFGADLAGIHNRIDASDRTMSAHPA